VVHDSKYLEREKHQLKRYFDKLAEAVEDADQLALFGPAETPEKFRAELDENYPELAAKVIAVEKADSQTDNQIKVLVKEAFGIDARYQ
jgi:stalled ribosome rescue protein Dom34